MKIEGNARDVFRAAKSVVDAQHLPEFNDRAWALAEDISNQFFEQRGGTMKPLAECFVSVEVAADLGNLITSALVAQKLKDAP